MVLGLLFLNKKEKEYGKRFSFVYIFIIFLMRDGVGEGCWLVTWLVLWTSAEERTGDSDKGRLLYLHNACLFPFAV